MYVKAKIDVSISEYGNLLVASEFTGLILYKDQIYRARPAEGNTLWVDVTKESKYSGELVCVGTYEFPVYLFETVKPMIDTLDIELRYCTTVGDPELHWQARWYYNGELQYTALPDVEPQYIIGEGNSIADTLTQFVKQLDKFYME